MIGNVSFLRGRVSTRLPSKRKISTQRFPSKRVFPSKSFKATLRYSMANGIPSLSPKEFYADARDAAVNGLDLIEEFSEVTFESTDRVIESKDPLLVETVAYFGNSGAFCESAARALYPSASLIPSKTWGGTIDELLNGRVDRAVIPVENFFTKRIRILYDLICKHDLHIVDERFLNVEHALLVKPDAEMNDIQVIASHIQALFQCENFVIENFPNVRLERMNDTALAAQVVAECPMNEIAAIASAACAETYGLKVLKDRIQDRQDNVTRFAALSRYPLAPDPSERSKTSILFALSGDRGSGALYMALQIFEKYNINLFWLDSRDLSPAENPEERPWNYLFYVNLDGSILDPTVKTALEELKAICPFFRTIGSYPMHARYLEDAVVI